MRVKVPVVPAWFFGMVIGLAGLGAAWLWTFDERRNVRAHASSWNQSSTCVDYNN
jgi:hypothetical protein